jgi:glycine/D-amino acid oxidase-like deaminating enzyme
VSPRRRAITVLGAGLTGAAVALELAANGKRVTLIDQDAHAVNRASLRNEGKIHLGLIYAHDHTLATAKLQLEGALTFRTLLRGWLGAHADALPLSTPFVYLVARDSLLTIDRLEQHYANVESAYGDFLRHGVGSDYLGSRPARLYERCRAGELPKAFDADHFLGGFVTQERAVDTDALARAVRDAIASNANIDFLPGHRVVAVGRANGRLRGVGSNRPRSWGIDSDQVVNALWEQRLAIDHSVGLPPEPGWLHRLKHRVIARLPAHLRNAPSATMVLGPYGDVVVRPDGTAYF